MTEHNDTRTAPTASPALSVDAPLFSRAAWARILPFGAYIFFIILGDMLERTGMARADLRWLYPVQIGVVAVLLAVFWRRYHELRAAAQPGAAAGGGGRRRPRSGSLDQPGRALDDGRLEPRLRPAY